MPMFNNKRGSVLAISTKEHKASRYTVYEDESEANSPIVPVKAMKASSTLANYAPWAKSLKPWHSSAMVDELGLPAMLKILDVNDYQIFEIYQNWDKHLDLFMRTGSYAPQTWSRYRVWYVFDPINFWEAKSWNYEHIETMHYEGFEPHDNRGKAMIQCEGQ